MCVCCVCFFAHLAGVVRAGRCEGPCPQCGSLGEQEGGGWCPWLQSRHCQRVPANSRCSFDIAVVNRVPDQQNGLAQFSATWQAYVFCLESWYGHKPVWLDVMCFRRGINLSPRALACELSCFGLRSAHVQLEFCHRRTTTKSKSPAKRRRIAAKTCSRNRKPRLLVGHRESMKFGVFFFANMYNRSCAHNQKGVYI